MDARTGRVLPAPVVESAAIVVPAIAVVLAAVVLAAVVLAVVAQRFGHQNAAADAGTRGARTDTVITM